MKHAALILGLSLAFTPAFASAFANDVKPSQKQQQKVGKGPCAATTAEAGTNPSGAHAGPCNPQGKGTTSSSGTNPSGVSTVAGGTPDGVKSGQ